MARHLIEHGSNYRQEDYASLYQPSFYPFAGTYPDRIETSLIMTQAPQKTPKRNRMGKRRDPSKTCAREAPRNATRAVLRMPRGIASGVGSRSAPFSAPIWLGWQCKFSTHNLRGATVLKWHNDSSRSVRPVPDGQKNSDGRQTVSLRGHKSGRCRHFWMQRQTFKILLAIPSVNLTNGRLLEALKHRRNGCKR